VEKCLNPSGTHTFAESHTGELFCSNAQCGFLRENAQFGRWSTVRFLQRNAIADLYLAALQGEEQERKKRSFSLLRIVRNVLPGAQQSLPGLLALHHPHLHSLQHGEWLEQYGIVYLLSRYEEGGSLAPYLGGTANLSLSSLTSILRQIADAVQFMHHQGLVHGRIKAENCLLAGPGLLQVSDFYDPLLRGASRSSSIAYPATEYQQERLTPASDQFALALLGRQLVNQYLVLSPQSSMGGVPSQRTGEYLPLLPFANPVDQALSKAASPLPGERFSDIQTFAQTLLGALESMASSLSRQEQRIVAPPSRDIDPRLRKNTGSSPEQRPGVQPGGGNEYSSERRSGAYPAGRSATGPSSGASKLLSGRGGSGPLSPQRVTQPEGATTLCRLPGHMGAITALSWTPDGRYLASGDVDANLRLWLLQGRIGISQYTVEAHTRKILALAWSPDGQHLASASGDGSIRLWRLEAGKPARLHALGVLYGHHNDVYVLDWSSNGQYLASGGKDRAVHIWDKGKRDIQNWRVPGRNGARTLNWSPDQQELAVGHDRQISVWTPDSGNMLRQWEAHRDEVRQVAWSPDGAYLASIGGKKDLRICLWNPNTGSLLGELSGHTREIISLSWSPSARWLTTVSTDFSLRFWEIQPFPGRQIGRSVPTESCPQVATISPNGQIALGLDTLSIQVLQSQ
jgi:WD40 repeat protein